MSLTEIPCMRNAKIADFREIDELVTKCKSNQTTSNYKGARLKFAMPGNHDLFCPKIRKS